MEEPLQPRAPQLRAGALREQSGEAATPASLGGPTLSRQPLLAPAFSSDTAPPPSCPPPQSLSRRSPGFRLASSRCCHQGQSGTSAPSPTRSHPPSSLRAPFLNFIPPGIQLSGSPITNSLASTRPFRPLSGPSKALHGQGPRPGLPHLGSPCWLGFLPLRSSQVPPLLLSGRSPPRLPLGGGSGPLPSRSSPLYLPAL